eukprot:gene25372-18572_t
MNVRIAFLGLWSLLKATHADVFDYECISDLPTCGLDGVSGGFDVSGTGERAGSGYAVKAVDEKACNDAASYNMLDQHPYEFDATFPAASSPSAVGGNTSAHIGCSTTGDHPLLLTIQ